MKKLLLSILVVLFAVPAFAVNIPVPVEGMKLDIYSSIRMIGFYRGANADKVSPAKSNFNYAMQGNSRFGIRLSYEGFFTNIETNFVRDGGTPGIGFRQLYIGYNFSNGLRLTVGQKTTLTGFSGTIGDIYFTDNGLNGFGAIGDIRRPQILFSYAGVDFAIIANGDDNPINNISKEETVVGLKRITDIPRFEIAYNLKFTNLTGKIFASYTYNTFKSDINEKKHLGVVNADKKYGLNAFAIGAHAKPTFGKMFVNAGVFYAMNAGVYGSVKYLALGAAGTENLLPTFSNDKDRIEDVHSVGIAAEAGMAFTPAISAAIGGGYQYNTSTAYAYSKNTYAVYVNAPWKINKYMTLIPQVGYYATIEHKATSGLFLAGAQLKVGF